MKKVLFLLAALLVSVSSVWAQVSYTEVQNSAKDGWQISLASYYRSTYAYINGNNLSVSASKSDFRFTLQWVAASNGFRLYDPATEKYVGKTPANASNAVPSTSDEEQAGIYEFQQATPDCAPGTGGLGFAQNSTACVYMKCLNANNATYPAWHLSGGQTGNVINWDSNKSGGGNAWVVMALEEPQAPSGPTAEQISELQTKINVALGKGSGVGYPKADAAERYALNGYDSYNYDGVTAGTYDDALAKYNAFLACTNITMPVEGRAYNILICAPNGTKYYLYRNNDGQLTTSTTEPVGNAAKFVASGIDGGNITFAVEGEYVQWFCTEAGKCYNGNTKGLSATTNAATTLTVEKATATNYGSGNIEGATAEGLLGKVQIKGPGKTGSWYYNFRTDGAFISQYAGDKFYDDNWDNGRSGLWRTCFFELQQTELIVNNAWTDLEETLALADEYIVGEGYGQYTLAEGDWATAIANAEAELNTHTTAANAEALNTTITDYIAALTLNVPAAGSFVTLQNVHGTYLNGGATTAGVAARVAEPSLFYYDAEGHLIGYPGGYALNNGPAALLGGSTATYEFVKGTAKGKLAIKNSSDEYLMDWSDGRLDMFGSIESTCNYTIGKGNALPVAFHENGQGFATLYAPVALEIPEGVEAYTLAFDGTYLQATDVEDVIPAETGVVLKGTANSTKDFALAAEAGTAEAGVLKGSVATIAAGDGKYVFSIVGEKEGFYQFGGDNLAGFKAYYENEEASVQGFVINFGGLTTAINAAQQAQSQKASFDLQGRRVSKAVRGLFIQNGVKVIR